MRAPLGICSAALIASAALTVGARPASAAAPPKAASWRELGDAFEASRLLDGAARVRSLETLDGSVAQALRGGLDDERKLAGRFLAARLDLERGDFKRAADGFAAAADVNGKSRFADDASFAAIEALEAAGRDEEAARGWLQ